MKIKLIIFAFYAKINYSLLNFYLNGTRKMPENEEARLLKCFLKMNGGSDVSQN